VQKRLVALAAIVVAGVAGCADTQTMSRKAAHLTIDGATRTTSPAACSQDQAYRTIDISDRDGKVEAVVLLSGDGVIPQWVKIRNVDGFTGSFWEGGVGTARADVTRASFTISGSAYGINSSNPNRVVNTDFKVVAEC
jgi:type IV pilus biogenesis protein CpaD/CtpE